MMYDHRPCVCEWVNEKNYFGKQGQESANQVFWNTMFFLKNMLLIKKKKGNSPRCFSFPKQ